MRCDFIFILRVCVFFIYISAPVYVYVSVAGARSHATTLVQKVMHNNYKSFYCR